MGFKKLTNDEIINYPQVHPLRFHHLNSNQRRICMLYVHYHYGCGMTEKESYMRAAKQCFKGKNLHWQFFRSAKFAKGVVEVMGGIKNRITPEKLTKVTEKFLDGFAEGDSRTPHDHELFKEICYNTEFMDRPRTEATFFAGAAPVDVSKIPPPLDFKQLPESKEVLEPENNEVNDINQTNEEENG